MDYGGHGEDDHLSWKQDMITKDDLNDADGDLDDSDDDDLDGGDDDDLDDAGDGDGNGDAIGEPQPANSVTVLHLSTGEYQ